MMLVLFTTFTVMSQVHHLKAENLIISDGYRTETTDVDINVKLDISTNRLVIYSEETQIIDYEEVRSYEDSDGYGVVECTATDSDYKNIGLEILIHLKMNHIIILIEYKNLAYSYSCRFIR